MSRAKAPGKVVLSGAYAVLSGAPAIVSAVNRYVVADSGRPAELITPEVQAALTSGERAPWFDASALRAADRKLGLGSSAAILVASLYALSCDVAAHAEARPAPAELRAKVFERALVAHRRAQAGGSGVDVACSTFGGTLGYRLAAEGPLLEPLTLPPHLVLEVWTCPVSASTRELLGAVAELARRSAAEHERLLAAQAAAAEQALQAVRAADAPGFIAALRAQHRALYALGRAAGALIVTADLAELSTVAEAQGGVLLPAGAGGGDIALFAGLQRSTSELRAALAARAHQELHVELGVAGVGGAG